MSYFGASRNALGVADVRGAVDTPPDPAKHRDDHQPCVPRIALDHVIGVRIPASQPIKLPSFQQLARTIHESRAVASDHPRTGAMWR
jgi:hypothetical protein